MRKRHAERSGRMDDRIMKRGALSVGLAIAALLSAPLSGQAATPVTDVLAQAAAMGQLAPTVSADSSLAQAVLVAPEAADGMAAGTIGQHRSHGSHVSHGSHGSHRSSAY
jgi:hypothetical protein